MNDIDFEAEQAGYMAIDWLREAKKEIDDQFGEGFAKMNPGLLGSFIQAASIKYHASAFKPNHMVKKLEGNDGS